MAKNIISEIIELDRQADIKIDEARKKSEQIMISAKEEAVAIYNKSLEHSKEYSEKVDNVFFRKNQNVAFDKTLEQFTSVVRQVIVFPVRPFIYFPVFIGHNFQMLKLP